MRKPRKMWHPHHTSTLEQMNAVGYTDEEIARTTGHAPITVFYRRQALGLKPPKRDDWTKRTWKRAA